jgi:hypothetical protein
MGDGDDVALGFQDVEGFADGRDGDAELGRDVGLLELVAAAIGAGDDAFPEDLRGA